MIKVIFFLPQLGGGGAEMNAVRLAGGLLRNGVQPLYVVCRGPGNYTEQLPDGVEVIVLPTGKFSSSTLRLLRSVKPLVDLIESVKPDVICPVMPMPSLVVLHAVQRCIHRPKVALSIQSNLVPVVRRRLDVVQLLMTVMINRIFPRADCVIALSRGVAGDVSNVVPKLKNRIEVVHNVGLPLQTQLDVLDQEPPSRAPGVQIRFLACGRLVEAKGYPILLEAFSKVSRKLNSELLILGDGHLRSELEALALKLGVGDRVSFLGFRKNPFVYMHEADIFVLSSLWEGFANVIVEAMSMGTPVVATDCPYGPGEIITNGENGLLVEKANAEALSEGMLKLASDDVLRKKLVQAGKLRSLDFSVDRISAHYAEIFRNLASASLQGKSNL